MFVRTESLDYAFASRSSRSSRVLEFSIVIIYCLVIIRRNASQAFLPYVICSFVRSTHNQPLEEYLENRLIYDHQIYRDVYTPTDSTTTLDMT